MERPPFWDEEDQRWMAWDCRLATATYWLGLACWVGVMAIGLWWVWRALVS